MTQTPKYFLYNLLTPSERRFWIAAARTNIDLADLLLHSTCSDRISTKDPEFEAGAAVLVASGVLTQARVDEILAA